MQADFWGTPAREEGVQGDEVRNREAGRVTLGETQQVGSKANIPP
jgi:hypothetical protein